MSVPETVIADPPKWFIYLNLLIAGKREKWNFIPGSRLKQYPENKSVRKQGRKNLSLSYGFVDKWSQYSNVISRMLPDISSNVKWYPGGGGSSGEGRKELEIVTLYRRISDKLISLWIYPRLSYGRYVIVSQWED